MLSVIPDTELSAGVINCRPNGPLLVSAEAVLQALPLETPCKPRN
jgi:hypothetical protein